MDLEKWMMYRFYFSLWLGWATRLTLSTFIYAFVVSLFITSYIYVEQGSISLNGEIYLALFDVFKFWFMITWNIALLLALFHGIKYLFNSCHIGFRLELLTCPKEGEVQRIEEVGYGDLVKVWRKWFMLLIWLTGAQMIVAVAISALFSSGESVFEWFNIYLLYGFILISGYISFIIFPAKCKQMRIKKC